MAIDDLIPFSILSVAEIKKEVGKQCRVIRSVHFSWSRDVLAEKSGVSRATIQRFESAGDISFSNLISLAHAMSVSNHLMSLFELPEVTSIDELEKRKAALDKVRRK